VNLTPQYGTVEVRMSVDDELVYRGHHTVRRLIGEVLAPLLLIVGAWTRLAALAVVVNMVVAVLLAHTGQLFTIAKSGGYGLELQAMYLFAAISVALLGAGRYSVSGARGRWN
jgi:putative oxidoreductase